VRWFEFQDAAGKFFSWAGSPVGTDSPQRGATLLPKRAVDVMAGEVNRVLKLAQNAIVPISFVVPRKSYSVFHDDIFPDTVGAAPGTTADAWFDGANDLPARVSLDPARTGTATSEAAVAAAGTPASEPAPSSAPTSAPSSRPASVVAPTAVPAAAPAAVDHLAVKTETLSVSPSPPPSAARSPASSSTLATPTSATVRFGIAQFEAAPRPAY